MGSVADDINWTLNGYPDREKGKISFLGILNGRSVSVEGKRYCSGIRLEDEDNNVRVTHREVSGKPVTEITAGYKTYTLPADAKKLSSDLFLYWCLAHEAAGLL